MYICVRPLILVSFHCLQYLLCVLLMFFPQIVFCFSFIFFQLLGRICWFTSKRNEEASAMARSRLGNYQSYQKKGPWRLSADDRRWKWGVILGSKIIICLHKRAAVHLQGYSVYTIVSVIGLASLRYHLQFLHFKWFFNLMASLAFLALHTI